MNKLLSILLVTLLASCTNEIDKNNPKKDVVDPQPIVINSAQSQAPVFIRTTNIKDKLLIQRININQQNISLIDAINLPMPSISVVAKDSEVLLNRKISIRANNQFFGDYLKQLSSVSKYHITLNGNMVFIASSLSKSWDLSTLAMRNPSTSNEDISVVVQDKKTKDAPQSVISATQSDWQSIVDEIKAILGKGSIVSNNHKLGSIHATGRPDKMQLADKWIKELISGSQKQVFFSVAIIEKSISNSAGTGIDFSILSRKNKGVFNFDNKNENGLVFGLSPDALADGAFGIGNLNLNVLLNILENDGVVKVTNQPTILITNGNSATLNTGNNIDYIASVKSSTDQNGNIVTTPVIKKQNTGLKIKISAKISKDNKRITVNVLPTISTVKSATKLATGSGQSAQEVTLLDIALTELSTQVIVKPGQSILVGGLYADSIAKTSKGLNGDGDLLNVLFGSSNDSSSKKEILILLTPTLVQ
ncbi:hypothetical protein BSPWISOX_2952 [uncultured Gammaproteobacteria bacterium]|jgi:type II secretory pathway component GspD/PulD (secretin)|nr:hypothetical protein BSPWISOX_2952 [uncultured Gammaproteobacteria bacterium]